MCVFLVRHIYMYSSDFLLTLVIGTLNLYLAIHNFSKPKTLRIMPKIISSYCIWYYIYRVIYMIHENTITVCKFTML